MTTTGGWLDTGQGTTLRWLGWRQLKPQQVATLTHIPVITVDNFGWCLHWRPTDAFILHPRQLVSAVQLMPYVWTELAHKDGRQPTHGLLQRLLSLRSRHLSSCYRYVVSGDLPPGTSANW